MPERQKHGFDFEKYIAGQYNVILNSSYTSKWDGELNGHPVSIKHIKKGNAVDLADLFRQASIEEDFYMFLDYYTDTSDEIHILYIPANEWKKYFMPLKDFETLFKNALNNVSNDPKDDNKWTALRKECVDYWRNNTNQIITVNGKRDHKTQKRWQCSINNTNMHKEILPKYKISEEELNAKRNQK